MKHISLIVAACAAFVAATGFGQSVIEVNQSFETPAAPSGSYTVIQPGAGSSGAVPGWSIDSTGGFFAIINDQNNPSNALANQDGYQYLEDLAAPDAGYSGAGTVSQILSTSFVTGTEYTLFVWVGNVSGQAAQLGDSIFIANSSGTVLSATYLDTAPTNGSLAQFFVPFTSTGLLGDTGPIMIGFTGPAQTSRSIMAMDDFILDIAVPEPNSLAMAVFGSVVSFILLSGARRNSLFKHDGLPRRFGRPSWT